MSTETLLLDLLRINLVASAAVVLVLVLRPLLLPRVGARACYRLWLLVPVITLAGMLPPRERIVVQPAPSPPVETRIMGSTVTAPAAPAAASSTNTVHALALPALDDVLVLAWLSIATALLARSIRDTRRAARDPMTGPALIGVLRPQLILPGDFATRFNAQERALILAHENVHRISGHTLVNAVVELARCLCWFNPLAHVAAHRIRIDQELACDAAVIAAHPDARRAYAQALLKTQMVCAFLPLGCAWTSRSAERLHERISLLAQPSASRRAARSGAAFIAIIGMLAGYAAWAQQPERIVVAIGQAPARVWTPSADAPPDTLSHELEGQRHDSFIELAQQGGIDFVLFGATDAEMFSWPDRGKPVWDRAFADVNAANFGAQGTSPRSLLWRMQNGELDGYRAKLIVVEAGFCMGDAANAGNAGADARAVYDNCTPIFMEIAKRQPQAKVLVVPPFPRGFQDRAQWIQIASQNQVALNQLRDGERVFYADFGERFFLPDGSHNTAMWARAGSPGAGVGAQPAAFEAEAEELQPWLDRFVR